MFEKLENNPPLTRDPDTFHNIIISIFTSIINYRWIVMKYPSWFISLYLVSLLLVMLIPLVSAEETYTFQWAVPSVVGIKSPFFIATDSSGNWYATDRGYDCVWKYGANGTLLTKWGSLGTGRGQFDRPGGIAVDASGYVYVVDSGNNRIQKFTSDGSYIQQWGSEGTGNGEFYAPTGIAVNSSGYVYVVDSANHRVQRFTSSGEYLSQTGSGGNGELQFAYPTGIAIDPISGDLQIADTQNNRIKRYTSDLDLVYSWGNPGTGHGEFNNPAGIAVDNYGYVYVVDYYNHRVQIFDKYMDYSDEFWFRGNRLRTVSKSDWHCGGQQCFCVCSRWGESPCPGIYLCRGVGVYSAVEVMGNR